MHMCMFVLGCEYSNILFAKGEKVSACLQQLKPANWCSCIWNWIRASPQRRWGDYGSWRAFVSFRPKLDKWIYLCVCMCKQIQDFIPNPPYMIFDRIFKIWALNEHNFFFCQLKDLKPLEGRILLRAFFKNYKLKQK